MVIHPEFVNGKYAVYTRPQDGFIDVGNGGGIGLGYITNMENPIVENEKIIYGKTYHTVYELKNGTANNILSKETNLISNNIIDDVSDEMNDQFDKILDIE